MAFSLSASPVFEREMKRQKQLSWDYKYAWLAKANNSSISTSSSATMVITKHADRS